MRDRLVRVGCWVALFGVAGVMAVEIGPVVGQWCASATVDVRAGATESPRCRTEMGHSVLTGEGAG